MGDGDRKSVDIRLLPFVQQVDAHLRASNPRGPSLWLGRTPACLRMLGFPDLPLRMTADVFLKVATGKRGEREPITRAQLTILPELLDAPMALFESATVSRALVVLTTATSKEGLVIASLEGGCREANTPANLITSVYAKSPRFGWFAKQVSEGRLRYADKEKGFDTLEVSGRTLNCGAEPGSRNPSARKVLLPEDLRKYREDQRALKIGPVSAATR